jgi:hypothetical protein
MKYNVTRDALVLDTRVRIERGVGVQSSGSVWEGGNIKWSEYDARFLSFGRGKGEESVYSKQSKD